MRERQGHSAPADEEEIAAAVAGAPGLAPAIAADLHALLRCVHATCPGATTVLGGSLASATTPVDPAERPDIDLFVILPSRAEAWRVLRSAEVRRRLGALRLGVDAEIVVLWLSLVRRGRTSVHGRVLIGDRSLAAAVARSPAPPAVNLLASAHLYLVQSLLDPPHAERLLAKALVTGFRAWLRARRDGCTMDDLFSPASTAAELARAAGALPPETYALLREALERQAGHPVGWDPAHVRAGAHRFLGGLDVGRHARPLRRWLRHAGTCRHLGVSPFRTVAPTRVFVAAARALVAATTATDDETSLAHLEAAERALGRLLGVCGQGTRVERLRFAARVLAAYGRCYPHKILLAAPPSVPRPAEEPTLISVVVPCLNGAATLGGLLESIAAQETPAGYAVETIVVDNGSTDGSAEVARAHGVVVEREARHGSSAARNAGARRGGGRILVFLDADTRLVGRDFFHHVLRPFALSPSIGVVGASIECDETAGPLGRADHMVCFFNWQATQPAAPRQFQPSAAFAARRAVWEATRGFDPDILAFHDFDFCRRARALGYTLYFEPAARVVHVPRRGLRAILRHSFDWGWSTRQVYAPHDPARRWWFLDRPLLFLLNVPVHVGNRVWVVVKRWFWRRPAETVLLLPLLMVLLASWGGGVARGGYAWIARERRRPPDASQAPRAA
jgi:glycosyltransferase involved in cell wall biosynthesis